ncbi:MAG: 5'-methylthioadenosine/S-adenosylhomocysteine nucleosidase [Chloroflexi bacterium]|nr:5'-methylthioadenosine/S-adenosylhomocysteine nucleosidase [Chloroflexota bacterium]MBI3732678.1 5'-methylthioadenosine/S-adenosylhomocysteine nucleosidase [Chloroflexota bacterium]
MLTALVGALAVEVAPLVREAQAGESELHPAKATERRLGQPVYRGRLGATDVLIVEVGIGKVRAAATLQSVIERYPIERVIALGSAGAVNPGLSVGDVVIAQRVTQHDFMLITRRNLPGAGHEWIMTDAGLTVQLVEAATRVGLGARVKTGSIITGDTVIVDSEARQRLWETFGADCVEMEGAALALVCTLNQIPFALARGLTDRADAEAVGSFRERINEVSETVASVVMECVRGFTSPPAPLPPIQSGGEG